MFPSEVEKKIKERAAQKGLDTATYLIKLVQTDMGAKIAFAEPDSQDDDFDPEALNRAVAAAMNRTPEQRRAAREKAIKESQPRIELPPGVSPFDVMPVIRGSETDQQVIEALKELS